jgi:hypothetical protein
LVNSGFAAAFTAYGTVGHEFPYFGIPVVNAGDNPHIDYGFCAHPRSRQELGEIVRKIDAGDFHLPLSRPEILEFYYMHNLYHHRGRGDAAVRETLSEINGIRDFNEIMFKVIVGLGQERLIRQADAIVTAVREIIPEI